MLTRFTLICPTLKRFLWSKGGSFNERAEVLFITAVNQEKESLKIPGGTICHSDDCAALWVIETSIPSAKFTVGFARKLLRSSSNSSGVNSEFFDFRTHTTKFSTVGRGKRCCLQALGASLKSESTSFGHNCLIKTMLFPPSTETAATVKWVLLLFSLGDAAMRLSRSFAVFNFDNEE